MSLSIFLKKIKNNESISFDETMTVITEHYHYQPCEFSNGIGENKIINTASTNEGSCKIFAFAQINQLDRQQTLNLFGDFYRIDVLKKPQRNDHQNIRNFIQFGWDGINFSQQALTQR